jgi:excisionase family DNA binding protein
MTGIFTPSEAAEYAGLSDRVLRTYCKTGRLPAKRVGRTWAIKKPDLDKFLKTPRPVGNPNFRKR